jgi:cell division septal protein FtsQ
MKKSTRPARNQRVSTRKQRKQQHLLDVKVRARAASKNRNRQVLALLSAVVLICGAVGGAWYGGREALRKYFWQNPDYNLSEISIHTDGKLTREQVLGATNIEEGKNIFTVDLSAARKGLIALPQVDRAEIERILPNKIAIDIAERKPVAWVAENDDGDPSSDPGAYLIDRNGILIRMKIQVPEYYHLPVICGLTVENYEEGETVDLPEMKAALELIRLTGENPARYQVRSIDVSKGYCMVVTDERHARITFALDDIPGQLNRLAALFANVDAEKKEIQTVNLMVKRNVPVTFVPPPEADDATTEPAGDGTDKTDGTDGAADVQPTGPKPLVTKPAQTNGTQTSESTTSRRAKFLSATKRMSVKRAEIYSNSGASTHHSHTPTVRRAIPISSSPPSP